MSKVPTKEVDIKEAEKTLEAWLKGQSLGIMDCIAWERWSYNERPFWSVWGWVYGKGKRVFSTYCGIHVYDNGEVIIVVYDYSRMPE